MSAMRALLPDLRYGCRLLLKRPATTGSAVLALALGIGVNSAIFSVVNAVVLRPLPFRQADRLVTIRIDNLERNIRNATAPYQDIADWRRQARSFESLCAAAVLPVNLAARD